MGYWEQIAKENRLEAERRARMHPLRRRIGDALGYAAWMGGGLILWAIMLAPLWQALMR